MQKTRKEKLSAFILKMLIGTFCILQFALPSAAAPLPQAQTIEWTAPYILYNEENKAESSGYENFSNVLSITADKALNYNQLKGETVTFEAAIQSDERIQITGFVWKVNGKPVRTANVSNKGTYKSKYSMKIDSPASISCEYSGKIETTGTGKTVIGQFSNHSSPVLTVGYSNDPEMNDTITLSPAGNTSFKPATSGKYGATIIAGDGTTSTKTLNLSRNERYDATFDKGTTSFCGTTVSMNSESTDCGQAAVILVCKEQAVDIIQNPSMVETGEGEAASFSVKAHSGDAELRYQWYETLEGAAEKPITGATSDTLELGNVQLEQNNAAYRCKVSNGAKSSFSKYAALHVFGKPTNAPTILVLDNWGRALTGGWETQPVTLTATIPAGTKIEGYGELGLRYTLDDGKTWTELKSNEPDVILSENQEYNTTLRVQTYNAKWDSQFQETSCVFQGDMKSPAVKVEGVPSSWTNKEITLTIKATDNGCGLAPEPFSWDGGYSWTSDATLKVSASKDLVLYVKDRFGHTTYQKLSITQFDMVAPTLDVSGNRTEWGKESITLTAKAEDDISGLANNAYSWDGGKTWSSKTSYVAEANENVLVSVKDNAGNVTSKTIVVNRIDDTEPSVKIEGISSAWTNQNVTLAIKAADTESGLPSDAYSWDGGKTWGTDATKEFSKNESIQVCVRDNIGNIARSSVPIKNIDKTLPPEFDVTGNPSLWTNEPITLKVIDAKDTGSGLAYEAYNWNNTGWTTSNQFEVTENGQVTVAVRDKAGNERVQTIIVSKVDTKAPVISSVTGIPEELQTEPAIINIEAIDNESGLDSTPYSFDDGITWQSEPSSFEIADEQAIGIKVRDVAGNVAYYPVAIKTVDATGPSLTVSYLSITEDHQSMTVLLDAYDTRSKDNCEYCFNYDESTPDENIWVETPQDVLKVGKTVVVAARDEAGNVTSETITPNLYSLSEADDAVKLFTNDELSISGYTLGAIDGEGNGIYIDNLGILHEYGKYNVNGKAVSAIPVRVEAAPISGGVLKGEATLSGITYPIYWNNECTKTETLTGGAGYFFVDPSDLYRSARTASLKVVLKEYDKDGQNVLNSDSLTVSVTLDFTPPTVNISLAENAITIDANDTLSGISSIKYRIKDKDGESDWMNYTSPITLLKSASVTVQATDKAGNQSTTSSKKVTIAGSVSNNTDVSGSFYYRSTLFEHYLFGTTQTSILKKEK